MPAYAVLLALLLCTASVAVGLADEEPVETVHLKSGGQLSGISRGVSDGHLLWELPNGDLLRLPLASIEHVDLSGPSPPPSPVPESALPPPPDAAPEEKSLRAVDMGMTMVESVHEAMGEACDAAFTKAGVWTKRIELGARFLDGNTNDDFLNLKTVFEQQTDLRSYQVESGGRYGKSNGERAANQWYTNGTFDFAKEGNWIVFVKANNKFDEFANLDYRGTLSGGLGYRFYNESDRRLIVRLGPAVTYEKFHGPTRTRTTPDMLAESELRWPLFERTQFENKTTLHPSVSNIDVFRLTSDNGLLVDLDEGERWRLKLGFLFDYNSSPNNNRVRSDYTTNVLLVYTRK